MDNLSMRLGKNVGSLLLDIAQENIAKGNPEKAITIYTEGLQGFTKEYAITVLKNEYVLCVDTESQEMYLSDDVDTIAKNKSKLYDWNAILEKIFNDITEDKLYCDDLSAKFNKILKSKASIYDFNLIDYGRSNNAVDISHLCARVLANNPFDNCHGSGENIWYKTVDKFFDDELDEHLQPFVIVAEFVKKITELCNNTVKFCKMYEFLYEHGMCERIPYFEYDITNLFKYIDNFTDTEMGYYHPMCNVEIYNLKENLIDNILSTKIGSEYLKYGVVSVSFEDKYDAGWLTTDGKFYADNGTVGSMIHFRIARDIYEHTANPVSYEMKEANVSLFSTNCPERFLEHKGWMKIHYNEVHGCFSIHLDDCLSEPTDAQVNFICKYMKAHYNGLFYNEPQILRSTDPISVAKLRQMDKFKLREVFGL